LQKDLEAEKVRLEEETKRRENERLIQQRKEIEKAEALKLAEKLAQELMDKNIKVNKEVSR
jgi:cysteinyl-tRNA synthetase